MLNIKLGNSHLLIKNILTLKHTAQSCLMIEVNG